MALFEGLPLIQNSKFNNLLWICWVLCEKNSDFVLENSTTCIAIRTRRNAVGWNLQSITLKISGVFFLENNKWACPLITEARCEQSCYTNNLICSFERKIKMKKQLESSKLQSFTSKSMSMINLNSNLIWHWYVNISTRKFGLKVISILEACFDLISSPSPSMKIQIMGGKITENLGFKSFMSIKFAWSMCL